MLISDTPRPFTPSPLTQARINDGGYAMNAQPRRVDAGSARLDRACGDGWLAIGDAAMSFDPISSHGLLTALATGLAAGETSLAGYQAFVDTTWRAYARMRQECYGGEGRWGRHRSSGEGGGCFKSRPLIVDTRHSNRATLARSAAALAEWETVAWISRLRIFVSSRDHRLAALEKGYPREGQRTTT